VERTVFPPLSPPRDGGIFVDQVMAEVRRGASHGRFSRLARMAAAVLIAGGLAAAGYALLQSGLSGPTSGPEIVRPHDSAAPPAAAMAVSTRPGAGPAERRMRRRIWHPHGG